MENRETKEYQSWKLGGYEVERDGEGLGWVMYMLWPDGPDEESPMSMSVFWGRAWIEHDTLLMTSWKVHDYAPEDLQTDEEVDKYMASLPVWDKTTYCVKLADIGMSGLIDCKTLREVPEKEATPIMLALGFTKFTPPKALQEAEEKERVWPTQRRSDAGGASKGSP